MQILQKHIATKNGRQKTENGKRNMDNDVFCRNCDGIFSFLPEWRRKTGNGKRKTHPSQPHLGISAPFQPYSAISPPFHSHFSYLSPTSAPPQPAISVHLTHPGPISTTLATEIAANARKSMKSHANPQNLQKNTKKTMKIYKIARILS